jgi:hypothetical protein
LGEKQVICETRRLYLYRDFCGVYPACPACSIGAPRAGDQYRAPSGRELRAPSGGAIKAPAQAANKTNHAKRPGPCLIKRQTGILMANHFNTRILRDHKCEI